jgi:hypothetical protein
VSDQKADSSIDAKGWKSLVESAMQNRPPSIQAQTYGGQKWGTRSKPVVLRCSDKNDYVVKGKLVERDTSKSMITEQIIGTLGKIFHAPVPKLALVDVSAELINGEEEIKNLLHPGVAHGKLYIPNCGGPTWISHPDVPENKIRHARLAILYGWFQVGDQQIHYELSKPEQVWSWDHEGFGLCRSEKAVPYNDIVQRAKITPEQLAAIKTELEAIGPAEIAIAVASPHETWGITIDTRVVTAQHLEHKRVELIASLL